MSNENKSFLSKWRLSNPKGFGQSKKRTLDTGKGVNGIQRKHQKRKKLEQWNQSLDSFCYIFFKAKFK